MLGSSRVPPQRFSISEISETLSCCSWVKVSNVLPPTTTGTIPLVSPTRTDRPVQVLEKMEKGGGGTDIPLPSQ